MTQTDDFAFTDPDAYDVVINGVFFDYVDRKAQAEAIENEAIALGELFGIGVEVEFFGIYQDRRGNYYHQFKGNIPLAPAARAKLEGVPAGDGDDFLSAPGRALRDALIADNDKHHDNAFLEPEDAVFCDECGRNYAQWSHSEDCASGAADRILSGEATPFD